MADEPITEVQALNFTRHVALVADEWPERIAVTDTWLKEHAYKYGAAVDGDTISFTIGNGEAEYLIDREQKHGKGYVATLVTGNTPASLKQRKAKYETKVSE